MSENKDKISYKTILLIIMAIIISILSITVAYLIGKGSLGGGSSTESSSKFKEVSSLNKELETNEENTVIEKDDRNRRVMASRLNIRVEPSLNNEPIGTAGLNSVVKLIEVHDDEWALVELTTEGLNKEDGQGEVVLSDPGGNSSLFIKPMFVDEDGNLTTGNRYYLHRSYLVDESKKYEYIDTSNAKKPFVYGLMFYNDDIAKIVETEIWKGMSDKLKAKGYDGVKVISYVRDDFKDIVYNKEVDAIESASGDLAEINEKNRRLETFSKNINKNTGESDYAGIIIANKDSGINSVKDIEGHNIAACKPHSDSGNQFQRYYLKNKENIELDNLKIDETNQHADVFIKVAKGDVPVGFCGNFVLTDFFTRFKKSAEELGVEMNSEEDLNKLKDNLIFFELEGINKIPNNPHSLRTELASDKDFVNSLKSIISMTYNDYRDDFGMTDAHTEEYNFLNQIKMAN